MMDSSLGDPQLRGGGQSCSWQQPGKQDVAATSSRESPESMTVLLLHTGAEVWQAARQTPGRQLELPGLWHRHWLRSIQETRLLRGSDTSISLWAHVVSCVGMLISCLSVCRILCPRCSVWLSRLACSWMLPCRLA